MRDFPGAGEANHASTSRRDLLKAFTAAGAGALLSKGAMRAQNGQANPRRIDMHHHFQIELGGGGGGRGRGGGGRPWTPAESIDQMDKHGIAFAMLSHPGNGDEVFDGTPKGAALARQINEGGAKIVSDNSKRFGLFAVLPMPDVDGSLRRSNTPSTH